MSRYVPPALRNKSETSHPPPTQAPKPLSKASNFPSYTLEEIRNHYFPSTVESTSTSVNSTHSKTLHDSAATPGKLSHILLFKDANPRWESDSIIFTKSALELLPAGLAESSESNAARVTTGNASQNDGNETSEPFVKSSAPSTPNASSAPNPDSILSSRHNPPKTHPRSIAVYAQTRNSSRSHSLFTFTGYYNITNLQFLDPRTPDLIRMLEQKWSTTHRKSGHTIQKSRSKEEWDKSLRFRWAVVRLAKDNTEAIQKLGAPQIEKLEPAEDVDRAKDKKSVNEMLREMRLGGRNGPADDNDNHDGTAQAPKSTSEEAPTVPAEARRAPQAPTRQPRAPTNGGGMVGFSKNKGSTVASTPEEVDRHLNNAESTTVGGM